MTLFFIIDETAFYHPDFLARFLERTPDEVVGAARVTQVPAKNNIEAYIVRHGYYLRPGEIARLAFRKMRARLLDRFAPRRQGGAFYSVRAVLEHFGIDYFDVANSINRSVCLDRIRAAQPDVIVSSNSLIFGEALLNMPSICCLNRHSALLPAYGGLWPVFQAWRSGEKTTGVSIHTMEKEIDRGIVLSSRTVPIEPGCTIAALYKRCFELSVDALLEALDRVRNNDWRDRSADVTPSYYSFPTRAHWKEFRARGGRFA
ncbi:MAG: hypothetical protein JW951_10370 [Lentisphaerae bacterium]|nr:hypothetical protein [Lentisphaerota bacterium]